MSEINEMKPLLEIKDLHVAFETKSGLIPAVRGVNLTIYPKQSVAIVGESGSGKSTTAQAIIDLLPGSGKITQGEILLNGVDLSKLSKKEMTDVRGAQIGYVPQDPMSNLNPVWNIGFQVEEAVRFNGVAKGKKAIKKYATDVLTSAGLPDAASRMRQYPHEFSGGMRQRALIGIGLSSKPQLLIADEPTSALDVTVQRQILDHLETLTEQFNTSVLFITHDLGLAAERAEHLIVMYQGQVVESGPSKEILRDPQHPYTKRLVAAAPSIVSMRLEAEQDESETSEKDSAQENEQPLIEIKNAVKTYKLRSKGFKKQELSAVDDISISVAKGTTAAVVGESGSGKSTLAKLFLQLEPLTSGEILFEGKDITNMNASETMAFRRRVQPVFQDPYGTLDPQYSVGNTIAEPLVVHGIGTASERQKRVAQLLEQVALPVEARDRYPSELSGGQRQRVAIARALALNPDVLVLDEAVSALDVLVQGQILDLLTKLQKELGLTYLFITHDLAVVRLVADHVFVMKQGKVVESATTSEVFDSTKEQYTKDLIEAIPGRGLL